MRPTLFAASVSLRPQEFHADHSLGPPHDGRFGNFRVCDLKGERLGGIVKVTIVRRDVTQYDKIVAGVMTQERATPSTKPTVFLCMFRG
jgi:hypothetical protein